jgi:hypothetical protein
MDGQSVDWIALYKLGRLAFLACALLGIAVWLWRRPQLEQVARRMLEDEPS